MKSTRYILESDQLFSESLIWQLNRDFYQKTGPRAFSDDIVPHNLTSSSSVGKIYAELIFGFLKDLSAKSDTKEPVNILELGAGHGRLAFHTLVHLDKLIQNSNYDLPPYCYILSDIVEDNLSFFLNHTQLKQYLEKGVLDVSYYDAIESKNLYLRYSKNSS